MDDHREDEVGGRQMGDHLLVVEVAVHPEGVEYRDGRHSREVVHREDVECMVGHQMVGDLQPDGHQRDAEACLRTGGRLQAVVVGQHTDDRLRVVADDHPWGGRLQAVAVGQQCRLYSNSVAVD